MNLPNDPVMLLSVLNLKLRDFYASLDALCEDMDIDKQTIIEKMKTIDYHYDEEKNQFVWAGFFGAHREYSGGNNRQELLHIIHKQEKSMVA